VPFGLQAGASTTFEATADFRLQTSQPVVVATFMEGSQAIGFDNAGDPAQSVPIPLSQARTVVDFVASPALAPAFAQLIAPSDATVIVDGAAATGWTAIGSSGYSTTNVPVCCTDTHRAVSNGKPFLLSVYSYPLYTSYWYPAFLGAGDVIFADGFD